MKKLLFLIIAASFALASQLTVTDISKSKLKEVDYNAYTIDAQNKLIFFLAKYNGNAVNDKKTIETNMQDITNNFCNVQMVKDLTSNEGYNIEIIYIYNNIVIRYFGNCQQ